eukprot:TRINITY_DN1497_c0_g1_i2.p1 TRINITY_DN1497_c0_g1~~TRINITY_DN1497_c0_g1_i2.p1  ORF type:complete len:368 (-),score=94.81 TRINITY_DN1497_c0_g1_i2:701-1747(-)
MSDDKSEDARGFRVEYAKTGRSTCKDAKCKLPIATGEVRIAKMVQNPYTDSGADMPLWYHVQCVFDNLSRGRAGSKRIEVIDDLEGYADLKAGDKKSLKSRIEAVAETNDALSASDDACDRLENTDGDNNKFWSVQVAGSKTLVKWGNIGEEGFQQLKEHADDDAAIKFKDKMIKQKLGRGYAMISGSSGADDKSKAATSKAVKKEEEEVVPKEESRGVSKKRKATAIKKEKEEKEGDECDATGKDDDDCSQAKKKSKTEKPAVAAAAKGDASDGDAHGFAVEYAKSGRAKCRDSRCPSPAIEKGAYVPVRAGEGGDTRPSVYLPEKGAGQCDLACVCSALCVCGVVT